MLIGVAGLAVNYLVNKVSSITCYTTYNDSDKKEWLTNLMGSLLQMDNGIKLEMFLTRGDVNCHLLDILRSLTKEIFLLKYAFFLSLFTCRKTVIYFKLPISKL